jgi:hypothetical protein
MQCWALVLLLLVALCTPAGAFVTHDLPAGAAERDAVLGDAAGGGYVASGCWTGAPASGLTLTLPDCAGYAVEEGTARQLKYWRQAGMTWTLPASDGTWWLLGQWQTQAQGGLQALPGTHYLWTSATVRPTAPSGTLLLAQVTAVAGVVTVRNLWATNPHHPGRIYATDPAIGMVCDGHTDESAKLQRAIDLASQRGGTTIELPGGTCVVGKLRLTNQPPPGGLDEADIRRGCPSLVGQGVSSTTLTGPDTLQPEDWILKLDCWAFGGPQIEAPPRPDLRQAPGSSMVRDLTFAGRQERDKEYHALIVQGTYTRVQNVQFHWINGHALWIGQDTKLESGWFDAIQVRGSGRYVTDCGCSTGTATRNAAAVYLQGKHPDGHNTNNLTFTNVQVVYSWYAGLHVDCSEAFIANILLSGLMLHNHETEVVTTNQGRLHTNAGLVWIDGVCSDMQIDGFLANHPGADAADTANAAGPPVALFHLSDSAGIGRPDAVQITNGYFQLSRGGQWIRISKASTVFLSNLRFRPGADSAPLGQIHVADDAFFAGDPAVLAGELHVCNLAGLVPDQVQMSYAQAGVVQDCGRLTLTFPLRSDIEKTAAASQGTATMPVGGSVTVAHGLACTPTAGQITLTPAADPNGCTGLYVTGITATQFTATCKVVPTSGFPLAWAAQVPSDCGAALYATPETNVWNAGKPYYIHGLWFIPGAPAGAATATDYAVVKLSQRYFAAITDFASVSGQVTPELPFGLQPYIVYPLTFAPGVSLVWDKQASMVLLTTKAGAGDKLAQGMLVVQLGNELPLTLP